MSAVRRSTVGSLPEPDTRLLTRPPLEIVICEIRTLSDDPVVLGSAEGLKLKDAATAAGMTVERIEQTQQQAVSMQIAAGQQASPVIETRTVGWQLVLGDGNVATVLPGVVSIQATRYVSWERGFRPLVAGALAAFADVLKPQLRQRIGLRYVDRLVDPVARHATAWQGRVVDSLLGPIADTRLGERIVSSQQQLELEFGEHRRALLRHGPFSDEALHGAVSYLLDIDAFDTATTAFDSESTLTAADELNRLALSLFQTALSPEYLAELRGDE